MTAFHFQLGIQFTDTIFYGSRASRHRGLSRFHEKRSSRSFVWKKVHIIHVSCGTKTNTNGRHTIWPENMFASCYCDWFATELHAIFVFPFARYSITRTTFCKGYSLYYTWTSSISVIVKNSMLLVLLVYNIFLQQRSTHLVDPFP